MFRKKTETFKARCIDIIIKNKFENHRQCEFIQLGLHTDKGFIRAKTLRGRDTDVGKMLKRDTQYEFCFSGDKLISVRDLSISP